MKKLLSFLLIFCILLSFASSVFADDVSKCNKCEVSVFADNAWYSVDALEATYENNLYLSMRSLAQAFSSTSKSFAFEYNYTASDGSYFTITRGGTYEAKQTDNPDDAGYLELKRNRLFVDGEEKRYYSFRFGKPEDLYINVLDICFLFDIDASLISQNAVWFKLDTPFCADIASLDKDGYFDSVNCVLLGNINSGNISFSKNESSSFPIASITKLMSYLVIMDAVDEGRITLDDPVILSDNVQSMSESENGLIKMEKGQISTVRELIDAMLVASSNEASVALAEYVYGSESAFTTQMNRRAKSLGLTSAKFYNCNGLPIYSRSVFPVKRQNCMSGADLFSLVTFIVQKHPEITDITSRQFVYLPTFDYNTANSNPMVFNLSNVNGLKTGNTNLAGSCLVATDTDGNVAIVLGAEDNALRGRIAEILLRSCR